MYVKNVSSKIIIYTDEFKSHVIAEVSKSTSTKTIFISVGFNIESLGRIEFIALLYVGRKLIKRTTLWD